VLDAVTNEGARGVEVRTREARLDEDRAQQDRPARGRPLARTEVPPPDTARGRVVLLVPFFPVRRGRLIASDAAKTPSTCRLVSRPRSSSAERMAFSTWKLTEEVGRGRGPAEGERPERR